MFSADWSILVQQCHVSNYRWSPENSDITWNTSNMSSSGYEIVSEESITLAETQRAGGCHQGPLCHLLMWSYSFSLFLHTMGVETITKILKCWLIFSFLVIFGYAVFFSCEKNILFLLYIIQKVSNLIHYHCYYYFCLWWFATFFEFKFCPQVIAM